MSDESEHPTPGSGSGADFLQLDRQTAPARGVTRWLVEGLRSAIADGRLRPGSPLPATRTLAQDLGVSRGVVVEAYQRLRDEGLAEGRVGHGTVITAMAGHLREPRPSPSSALPVPSAGAVPPAPAGPPVLPLPSSWSEPVELDLSPGLPDLSAFPRAAWLRAERAVLRDTTAGSLGYGDPRGDPRLRRQLAGWLARTRGLRADPEHILVVAGVAQALALLAQTLRARGADTIAVEDPGSLGARQELQHWGLRPVGVPVDGDGLRVGELTGTGAAAALLTPAHQFPTGVVLAPRRRRDLLAWAREGRLVIEDDYDAEHRYDRPPVPALQASAPDHIAHTGSTSKTLAPGLRLGWLVPPRHLHADLLRARYASDIAGAVLPQLVLAHLIATGALDRHLRLVRSRHRLRRDAVLAALREHLPRARVEGVAAGLHLLLLLPWLGEGVDDGALAARVREVGVRVHPLSWHRRAPGPPGLVLGYAAHPPDRLREAVHRIAGVVPAGGVALRG